MQVRGKRRTLMELSFSSLHFLILAVSRRTVYKVPVAGLLLLQIRFIQDTSMLGIEALKKFVTVSSTFGQSQKHSCF